jgi:hypothetical protein
MSTSVWTFTRLALSGPSIGLADAARGFRIICQEQPRETLGIVPTSPTGKGLPRKGIRDQIGTIATSEQSAIGAHIEARALASFILKDQKPVADRFEPDPTYTSDCPRCSHAAFWELDPAMFK